MPELFPLKLHFGLNEVHLPAPLDTFLLRTLEVAAHGRSDEQPVVFRQAGIEQELLGLDLLRKLELGILSPPAQDIAGHALAILPRENSSLLSSTLI